MPPPGATSKDFPLGNPRDQARLQPQSLAGETLIVSQGSSPSAVPSGGVQHIKGQRGITPAERSKAPCHNRLQQAPGKGKAQGATAQGMGGSEWLRGAAGQIQARGEETEKRVWGGEWSEEAVVGEPGRRLAACLRGHVLCFCSHEAPSHWGLSLAALLLILILCSAPSPTRCPSSWRCNSSHVSPSACPAGHFSPGYPKETARPVPAPRGMLSPSFS